ncbi:hypothetical protein ACA910_018227 [Epithemia clementina (nom. ined.)]
MTSFALSLGSGLIAFGPLIALFSSVVYTKAQLVIVVTSSAFFFLMSSVVASFFWWIFYHIGLRGPMSGIIPGIISQFAFRCWFVSVYHRVEKAIQLSLQQQEAQDSAATTTPPQHQNQQRTSSESGNEAVTTTEDETRQPAGTNTNNWTEVAKLRLELNDAACGLAAGVGFGGMHAVLMYGTLLASEMTNNVGVLYQDSCPGMPSLAVSAIYALCFSILDIFFMLFTFFGMRRRLIFHRGEGPPPHLLVENRPGAWLGNTREGGNMALLSVLVVHTIASVFTTADYFKAGCMVSLPASCVIVIAVAYWFWAGIALIYMPPTSISTSETTAINPSAHYNSHND